jgi:hypothetical protein
MGQRERPTGTLGTSRLQTTGSWSVFKQVGVDFVRTASLVLGITGGVFGIIAALLTLLFGGLGSAFDATGAESIVARSFVAVFVGVVAIIGGALALRYPKVSAILQLITGVLGLILIGLFWIFSVILLLAGALLAFLGRKAPPLRVE